MTIFVSLPSRPPSPVSFSPPVRARSVSSRSSCSSAAESSAPSSPRPVVTSVTGVSSVSGVTPLNLQSLSLPGADGQGERQERDPPAWAGGELGLEVGGGGGAREGPGLAVLGGGDDPDPLG